MTASYDTIVLGGGVIGAAAAWALTQHDQRVLLLDRFPPGHRHGSSHGDGRIIRYSYPEAVYAEMAGHAYAGWSRLEAARGQRLIETTGGVDIAPRDSQVLDELTTTLAQLDVPHECLDPDRLMRQFPQLAVADDQVAVFQPRGGIVRADAAVAALWKAVASAGSQAMHGADVVDLEQRSTGWQVVAADDRRWTAPRLVLAIGGWTRAWSERLDLHLPLKVTRELLAYFPPRPSSPGHGVSAMPTIIDYTDDVDSPFYALPQIDVPGVKIGWHRSGPEISLPADGTAPTAPAADNLAVCQDWLRRRFPSLDPEPILERTCLYTNTPDFDFVIDQHIDRPRLVVAAGFSGHGFKFAPVVGDMVAALVLDRRGPVSTDRFRIDRFATGASG